jgi:hypothetical protein
MLESGDPLGKLFIFQTGRPYSVTEPSCLKMRQGMSKFWAVEDFALLSRIGKYFDYGNVKFRCRQATVAFLLLIFFGAY